MSTNNNKPIGRILLKDVRLAFPNLFEPTTVAGEGKPRFSATLLIPADHPQLDEIRAAQLEVAKGKWGAKAPAIVKGLEKQDKLALHDGDVKSKYDGFPGNFFISAAAQENAQPTVIDRDRSPLSARSGRPYAGCYVNASIELWAQDNSYGQRVNAQLRGVQFLRDGDSFSAGRPADAAEFDEVTEGADAGEFA
jgi:hypothetical protein